MDHRRHEAQNSTRALKLNQRGPVVVETIKNLGMDRIGRLQPFFVIGIAAFGRELLMLRTVQIGEGPSDHITVLELCRVDHQFKQTAAHYLEALFGAGGAPRGLDAADDVAQTIEGLPPAYATDFHIVGLCVRRARRVRSRQADHKKRILGALGEFRERLRKGELRFEAAGGEIGGVMKLARVGHPFVDENKARPVSVHKLPQRVAGAGRLFIIGGNPCERLLGFGGAAGCEAELPGEFAP